MPLLLNRHEIDDERWNNLVDESLSPLPYGYTWYLDVMAPGWNALVDADFRHVMPLTIGRKLGVEYLYQPYFTQQLGIFSGEKVSDDSMQDFFKELKQRFSFVQIHLHYNHQAFSTGSGQVVSQQDFEFKPRLTHHLQLDKPYDDIFAGYHSTLRKNVRQAIRKNLTITRGESSKWMIDNFRLSKGREVNELHDDDYKRLEQLIQTAVAKNCGDVYTVFNGEEKIASAFMLRNHRFVIPLFSIANAAGRSLNAMSFLFDRIIQELSGSNMIFDFEGSQIASINAFNRSFGAVPVTYWMLYRNALPWHARMLKKLKDALQHR